MPKRRGKPGDAGLAALRKIRTRQPSTSQRRMVHDMAADSLKKSLMVDMTLASVLLERLIVPLLIIVGAFIFGTAGFYIIGAGHWTVFECAYMTSITLTTVGYGETLDQMGTDARVFAMVMMWAGMGVTLYAVSTLTAFIVEKDLVLLLRGRRMEKRIAAMKGHIIVCGVGRIGLNVVKELIATGHPCVVVENNPERAEQVREMFKDLPVLQGEATDEKVLRKANIETAAGLVITLNDDSHNLLVTVEARYISPSIKIVARCDENNRIDKFYRAGANYVVNPSFIGGMRMASEMIRPHVVAFLDRMLRAKQATTRVEECMVCEGSPWVGMTLKEAAIFAKTGLTPVALKKPDSDEFTYNPSPEDRLDAGTIIVTIAHPDQIVTLRQLCNSPEPLVQVPEKNV